MRASDQKQVDEVASKLKALGLLGGTPNWSFLEAFLHYSRRYQGLFKRPTIDEVLEMLDDQCKSERVGPYEPEHYYSDY